MSENMAEEEGHVRWHSGYAAGAAAMLATEIGIALFVDDRIVRPLGGDALAVVLVYFALRAVTRLGVASAVATAFGLATAIELGQLFRLVEVLGLAGNAVVRTALGTDFDPRDFVAYAVGAAGVLATEAVCRRSARPRSASQRAS